MGKKYKVLIYLTVLLVMIIGGGFLYGNLDDEQYGKGMFSWEEDAYALTNRASFYGILETLDIQEVYQYISDENLYTEETHSFIDEMNRTDIALYYLTGESRWGLEKRGQSMLAQVNKIVAYNKAHKGEGQFKGIIFDVEPYLTEEWRNTPKAVMQQYITNLNKAYGVASKKGLYMIVCIPSWFDRDYENQLVQLITQSCDEVAIMNYDRVNEVGNIQKEIQLTKTYDKGINCIFEFQEPGMHGLEESQTYYHIGLEEAEKNFEHIYNLAQYKKLKFSYHYYLPVKKIMERGLE